MRILLVEDDESFVKTLTALLVGLDYILDVATDGEMAWEMILLVSYDLVILDIALPKLDGISLCQRLRSNNKSVLVMLLTARDTLSDKLLGLDSGADDYIVKPVNLQELLARIRTLLRRRGEPVSAVLSCGNLRFDPTSHTVSCNEQVIPLGRREYQLLELFLTHPHRVFSRSDIVDRIWALGEDPPTEDTIKSHIRSIRRKLTHAGGNDIIETLYGHGYRINPTYLAASPAVSAQEYQPVLAELTTQVWQLTKATALERIAILEQAAAALHAGTLGDTLHQQALTSAHKLIGSLGTLNFDRGSRLARKIERLLKCSPTPDLVRSLTQALTALRSEIGVEAQPTHASLVPDRPAIPEKLLESKSHILVVDDDLQILRVVKNLLELRGLQVTTIDNPAQIWQVLESVQPDLLILDIQMPQMSGLQVCQAIRSHPQWQWLPIMFLTVQPDRQTIQQGFAAGADDYVSKPIVPEDLWIRVHNRLQRTQILRNST